MLRKQFGFLVLLVPCCLIVLITLDHQSKLLEAVEGPPWQRDWQTSRHKNNNDRSLTFISSSFRRKDTRSLSTTIMDVSCGSNSSSLCSNATSARPPNVLSPPSMTTTKVIRIQHASPRTSSSRNRPHENCTCTDSFSNFNCCQRALIGIHKMGFTAVKELARKLYTKSSDMIATPQLMEHHHPYGRWFHTDFQNPNRDYRHVVVTRNWYHAILSGYLYHKSGKECWLDWFGRPGYNGWLLNNTMEDWEQRLLQHQTIMSYFHQHFTNTTNKSHTAFWNPGKGRDLCQYLADEPEDVGLRVYTAWSLACFLYPLLEFRHGRLAMEQQQGWNRTLFLCYEQVIAVSTPAELDVALPMLHRWLYPHPSHAMPWMPRHYQKYQGAHSTTSRHYNATTERTRLYAMLSHIDAEVFNNTIQQASAEFGCGHFNKVVAAKQ